MIPVGLGEHGQRHMAFACSRQAHDGAVVQQRATTSDGYRLTCARLGQEQRFQAGSTHASARACLLQQMGASEGLAACNLARSMTLRDGNLRCIGHARGGLMRSRDRVA